MRCVRESTFGRNLAKDPQAALVVLIAHTTIPRLPG